MALKKRPLQINGYTLPIRFTNRHSAEEFVERVFPTDYVLDVRSTIATGYNILRSTHSETVLRSISAMAALLLLSGKIRV